MWFLKPYKTAALFLVGSVTAIAQGNPQADVMKAYYGNTLSCSAAAMQCHIWFNTDGTYQSFESTLSTDGAIRVSGLSGEFKLTSKDGVYQTCLQPNIHDGPARRKPVECYPLGSHKLGDAWDAKTNDGTVIHFSLQAGRHVNANSSFL